MKRKAVNLTVDKKFYEEIIEPVLDEKGIIYSKFMMTILKKLKDQKRLSAYSVDSEIFPLEEYKILNSYVSTETYEMRKEIGEIFVPNLEGKKQSAELNKYLRDELYGFFYNYDDKNMIELARKYNDVSKNVITGKRDDNIFYSTSDDVEFLRMLKYEYDINRIVEKFVKIVRSESYNVYKGISSTGEKFYTVFPVGLNAKKECLNYCRFSLDLPAYGSLLNEANRYFLSSNKLFSSMLNYVKENIEDFEDCKINRTFYKVKKVLMKIQSSVIERYNIKENSEFKDIINRIDIDKLTEYVKHNKIDLVQTDTSDRTTVSVIMNNMSNDDFYTLCKIRKVYSIGWADIVRVALEKDLLKK